MPFMILLNNIQNTMFLLYNNLIVILNNYKIITKIQEVKNEY